MNTALNNSSKVLNEPTPFDNFFPAPSAKKDSVISESTAFSNSETSSEPDSSRSYLPMELKALNPFSPNYGLCTEQDLELLKEYWVNKLLNLDNLDDIKDCLCLYNGEASASFEKDGLDEGSSAPCSIPRYETQAHGACAATQESTGAASSASAASRYSSTREGGDAPLLLDPNGVMKSWTQLSDLLP